MNSKCKIFESPTTPASLQGVGQAGGEGFSSMTPSPSASAVAKSSGDVPRPLTAWLSSWSAVLSHLIILHHIILHHITLHHVVFVSSHFMSSHHITSPSITAHDITSQRTSHLHRYVVHFHAVRCHRHVDERFSASPMLVTIVERQHRHKVILIHTSNGQRSMFMSRTSSRNHITTTYPR